MAFTAVIGLLLAVVLLCQGRIGGSLEQCQTKVIGCHGSDLFPSIDGSCNNIERPYWGATGIPIPRLLSAEYDDGKDAPIMHGIYGRLPSTRRVSNSMKEAKRETSSRVSHLHVLWGQLMAHDFVHTPVVKKENGDSLDCECRRPHIECINIPIPRSDEQFTKSRKTCMELARSKPAVGLNNCAFDQREQINTLSSYIDGSMIYGRTWEECQELRDSRFGFLKMKRNPVHGFHDLLPNQNDMLGTSVGNATDCNKKVHRPVNVPCFTAGDVRNNENTGLTSITTTFVRYHNKIANSLRQLNPRWGGDKLFNVTRQIVNAALQIITYREYLPPLLGPKWTGRFGLKLAENGYWNGYDTKVNPAVTTEFATAAFRYGHSQVAESLSRPDSFFEKEANPPIKSEDSWFNAEPLLNLTGGGVGSIMRGFMIDSAEKTDTAFIEDLRNQLFTEFGKSFGKDLFAINTQRGRDHGIAGYNRYREICGLKRANTFEELLGEISYENLEKLKLTYEAVDDIDLYPGGIAETHIEGGEVGPTFACILAYSFRAMKKGDRYWHEHEYSPSAFTIQQLDALRKITYAKVLCDVAEEMIYVIKDPMLHSDNAWLRMARCVDVPALDISVWDERGVNYHFDRQRQDEELTIWFVTSATSRYDLDRHALAQKIKYQKPDEICDRFLRSEVRNVPGDFHLQIRFSCPAGSIRASDFPHQLSDQNYWTDWRLVAKIDHGEGFETGISEFDCVYPIAIQAMTSDGASFARETREVFENYDVTHGFTCLHKHQRYGHCSRYKVRLLCAYGSHSSLFSPQPSPPHDVYPSVGVQYSQPDVSVAPSRGTDKYKSTSVPSGAAERANAYCLKYGICCGYGIYTVYFIPSFVRKETAQMCNKYNICCDA